MKPLISKLGRLVRVKCYAVGCRRYKRGYVRSDGGFYDMTHALVANLREQDYACHEHGTEEPGFLFRDADAGPRSSVTKIHYRGAQ